MKSVILSTLLLVLAACTVSAQNRDTPTYRLGFTYDTSQSKSWGNNRPVIKGIIPYSSAEQIGIKKYGVIEEINRVPVTEVSVDEILQLLGLTERNNVLLTISGLSSPPKQVSVKKNCKKNNVITEDQLTSVYTTYSLETIDEQEFVYPFKTTVIFDGADPDSFKTFAFSAIDENNRKLETVINEYIENELTKKGFMVDIAKPDLLIQAFYFFDKNSNYPEVNKVPVEKEPTYRYNFSHSKMGKFPFLDYAVAEAEAEYLSQLGIRTIDQKDIPGRVLWECEANKLLENFYRLNKYARMHIPLMYMQHLYAKYGCNVSFKVSKKTYNYTGISYGIDKSGQVVDIGRNSSAYAAGIRPRDIIEKIGHHKMGHSAEKFSFAYKCFITNAIQCRDPKTMLTDTDGFKYCMSWDVFKHPQITDASQSSDYLSAFFCLYYLVPYTNPSGNDACMFNIKCGRTKLEVIIHPTIRSEVTVEIK